MINASDKSVNASERKIIFVHQAKAAGTSLIDAFKAT